MKTLKQFLRTLVHAGPIATLILVKTITLAVIYCSLMWWPPNESISGLLSLTSFLTASGLVMFNFFCAISSGPGFLPFKWRPEKENDISKLQYCTVCEGYKAPRAHHCRKCGRCVMKLDHHCPWINSCVGHKNHAHFFGFLLCAVIGCSQAAVILGCSLYRAAYRSYYVYYDIPDVPLVYLGLYGFLWILFSLGCAIGVALGVGILLYYQIKVICRNQTTIEEWIVEKAMYRRKRIPDLPKFIYPYDLGWKLNTRYVLNLACEHIGDGITWPVVRECDQYTLTIEQMEQKEEKKRRAREYVVVDHLSGSWCPISKGCGTLFHPPFTDESRMPLDKDDRIMVSRWKKYWMYGELLNDSINNDTNKKPSGPRVKGWFPRRCAVEVNSTPVHPPSISSSSQSDINTPKSSESNRQTQTKGTKNSKKQN